MDILLKLDNVTKIFRYGLFGFAFKAVDRVSLEIEDKPLIFTIAGESGSGKTTLARIVLGVLKPDEGGILYKNRNIYELSGNDLKWFRKEVQAVFQDPYASFNPLKKPYEYLVDTVKKFVRLSKKEEIDQYIDDTLLSLGLRLIDIKDKYPHEFSGGELQRVAIARALLTRPRLIIADEPVSMVDASIRVNILNIFREVKEKYHTSFIYITHDLATAYYISDTIAIMYRGMIIEKGSIHRVLLKPLHPYTQSLVDSIPEPDISKKDKWLQPIKVSGIEEKEFIVPGCKYVVRCPYAFNRCFKERPQEIRLDDEHGVACWLYVK